MKAFQQRPDAHDRRKRLRIPAQWKLFLFQGADTHPLETTTRDISSEGFYCFIPVPLLPGQMLQYLLLMPTSGSSEPLLCLEGTAQIRRLENLKEGYGIGCQVQEYHILTLGPQELREEIERRRQKAASSLS